MASMGIPYREEYIGNAMYALRKMAMMLTSTVEMLKLSIAPFLVWICL